MGVPWIPLRHRFPTGVKGKEEERKSGVVRRSFVGNALKYILLWSEGGAPGLGSVTLPGLRPLYCLSWLWRISISSTSWESLWKVAMGPPLGIQTSGTQRRKKSFQITMCEGMSKGIKTPCGSAGRENQSLKKRSDGLSSFTGEKSGLSSDTRELRRGSKSSPPLSPFRRDVGVPRKVELKNFCWNKQMKNYITLYLKCTQSVCVGVCVWVGGGNNKIINSYVCLILRVNENQC